jgi:uncharacterized membrane protein YkvA (DUF1232 family)
VANVSVTVSLLLLAAVALAAYAAVVLALIRAGRRTDARALAGFIPDCIVLFKRLLTDRRIPRRHKGLLLATLGYLAMPIDLVPDFIPVVGQLDDALVVVLALRVVLRGADRDLLSDLWPGPERSLDVIRRRSSPRGG